MSKDIYYSDKYYDEKFEYRHVVLPKELIKLVPKTHLMTENEWRSIGVQQSRGWIHYMIHKPEPHILLFRRPKTEDTVARLLYVLTSLLLAKGVKRRHFWDWLSCAQAQLKLTSG
ncbi:hypothetical protein ACLKA6_007027 [Drosophila palustris]